MTFALTPATAPGFLRARGLVSSGERVRCRQLGGGVSGSVVSVRAAGGAFLIKQSLARLRVRDPWFATQERTNTEARALRLAARLTPGAVPRVIDHDPGRCTVVLELAPPSWRNWQREIEAARPRGHLGTWAGQVLGRWHAATAGDASVARTFADHEAFDQLRLAPFHATVMRRRPELAPLIEPYLRELREARTCLVHGDFAPKNVLAGRTGTWVLDFEVAHTGHPAFDLGFMLSFLLLDAVHRPRLAGALLRCAEDFWSAYRNAVPAGVAPGTPSVLGHTACLVLARTDGTSPAAFLEPGGVVAARRLGTALLREPPAELAAAWAFVTRRR